MYWRGIVHDLSKFLPSEFLPYARHFYAPDGTQLSGKRNEKGYYKPIDTGDSAFDYAWFLHQKRNKHHWQYWCIPKDDGGTKALSMPTTYTAEMLCDWKGAKMAQRANDTMHSWWDENRQKMTFHVEAEEDICHMLNMWFPDGGKSRHPTAPIPREA